MKWPLTLVLIKTYKEMEKIVKKKSWRTLVFALGVVLLVGGGIFITCQKEANVEVLDSQQDHGVEYPIPEGAKALIMDVHFYKDLYPDYEESSRWERRYAYPWSCSSILLSSSWY